MKLNPLYKRALNGSIRTWEVSVHTDDGKVYIIERKSGQLLGVMTSNYDYIAEGKNLGRSNETTPQQQAELEAKSYWKQQLDNGYKEFPLMTDASPRQLHEHLMINLPEFNTDAQGNVKPMLAKAISWPDVKLPAFIQPKYDGVRCLLIIKDGDLAFLSRSGKFYTTLDHIADAIRPYLDTVGDVVLDGEIFTPAISFQEIISAVKKQGPNTPLLKFYAYDIVDTDLGQDIRLHVLAQIAEAFPVPEFIKSDTQIVSSKHEIVEYHYDRVKEGFEGAMVRHTHGKYKQGGRSSDLLKVKEFQDAEFVITGGKIHKQPITHYDGHDASIIDSFTFTCENENGSFDPKPKGDRALRSRYMRDLPNLVGKMLTVKYFGFTNDGLPRFPIGVTVRDYE